MIAGVNPTGMLAPENVNPLKRAENCAYQEFVNCFGDFLFNPLLLHSQNQSESRKFGFSTESSFSSKLGASDC